MLIKSCDVYPTRFSLFNPCARMAVSSVKNQLQNYNDDPFPHQIFTLTNNKEQDVDYPAPR